MATKRIRYLTTKPGAAGGLPRHFWQPSAELRAAGFVSQRVPLGWEDYTDERKLEAAAIKRAQELNDALDAWREKRAIDAGTPAPAVPHRPELHDLIAAYKASDKYKGLAASTKRGYNQCIDILERWAGDTPIGDIKSKDVQALKTEMAATPAFAAAIIRVLRLILAWGKRESWLDYNPAERPDLAGSEPGGLIWPADAVAAFVETADRLGLWSIGTAVMLNDWLGQRQGDMLVMSRVALRNGTIWVRQSKRGAGVGLPVDLVAPLVVRMQEEQARVDARRKPNAPVATTILVCEGTGLPWQKDYFRHQFAAVRAELAKTHPHWEIDHLMPGRDSSDPDAFRIATTDLTYMHLRHTAVTRLAEAEVDELGISAITGQSLTTIKQILERYRVRTRKAARRAFQKRLDAEGTAAKGAAEKERDAG